MKNSFRLLGMVGMLAAPMLWIETYFFSLKMQNSSITGIADLLYMIGWSCSIIGLVQLQAAGTKRIGKMILYLQLAFLTLANAWNIWVIIDPLSKSPLFNFFDLFWPISNVFMLVTGIAIIKAKKLRGLFRYTALLAGLWLPVTMVSATLLKGNTVSYYIMVGYALASFFLLGITVFRAGSILKKNTSIINQYENQQIEIYSIA